MKETTRNLLVGVFVLAAMIVFGVMSVWFGETPSWLRRAEWTLRIKGVEGLSGINEASPVNMNGVQIGRVQSLEFKDPQRPGLGVEIVTRIKDQYTVPEGAHARVYGATLGIGTGHVEIVVDPEAHGEPLDREVAAIPGEMRSVIGEMISKELIGSVERTIVHIGNLAEAATPVADNLATLLEERTVADVTVPDAAGRTPQPNLSTVVERIDKLVAHVNAVLGDEHVQGEVKAAVSDLKTATEGLRETVAIWQRESMRVSENVNTGIDRTEEQLEESFARLHRVLGNLDDASTSLARVLRDVEEGKGTAGLVVNDARLYEAAVLSFERLAEAVGTLQRILGKIEEDGYINVGKVTPVGTITKKFPVRPDDSAGN
ncbi:MAG: MlaD family protein [Phycisphaerae bacterium]|jgi:ABC-type transporter Mla subunit MlaD